MRGKWSFAIGIGTDFGVTAAYTNQDSGKHRQGAQSGQYAQYKQDTNRRTQKDRANLTRLGSDEEVTTAGVWTPGYNSQ